MQLLKPLSRSYLLQWAVVAEVAAEVLAVVEVALVGVQEVGVQEVAEEH